MAGPQHKVPLDMALKAMTIDAAYSIQQEKKVGSIEVGKDANLTVLEQSPYDVAPEKLKDITVWGTMLEGRIQPVSKIPKVGDAITDKSTARVAALDDAALTQATAISLAALLAHSHVH